MSWRLARWVGLTVVVVSCGSSSTGGGAGSGPDGGGADGSDGDGGGLIDGKGPDDGDGGSACGAAICATKTTCGVHSTACGQVDCGDCQFAQQKVVALGR